MRLVSRHSILSEFRASLLWERKDFKIFGVNRQGSNVKYVAFTILMPLLSEFKGCTDFIEEHHVVFILSTN